MITNRIQLENITGDQPGTKVQIQQSNLPNQTTDQQNGVLKEKEKQNVQTTKPWPLKPFIKRTVKPEDYKFKWVAPEKVYPAKYGPTKIRIIQNLDAHNHMNTHKINVFFA